MSDYHFVVQLNHFITNLRTLSVAVFLKRQSDVPYDKVRSEEKMHQDFMKLSDHIGGVDKQAQQQLASSFRQLQDGQNKAMQLISEGAEAQHAKYNSPGRVCHYVQISTERAQRSIRPYLLLSTLR